MNHQERRHTVRQLARQEGRAVAETMIGQEIRPEQIADLAQQAAARARPRLCLSPALAQDFHVAFIKAVEVRLREAATTSDKVEG